MEPSFDTIIEESRNHLMLSSSSSETNPVHRTAYFLKPCMKQESPPQHHFLLHHSTFSSKTTTSNPSKLPLQVTYNGWKQRPQEEWKNWVQKMQQKYEHLWTKVGIDQAIVASTYQIHRNDELILELAQRWCSKTNTFIFPWGEATITLQDMKVCCGYSIMGENVSTPLVSDEEKEIEAKLVASRRIFNNTKARKVVQHHWMMHFMRSESSELEHEAFLVLWLSRFVFPSNSHDTILRSVFPIAVNLARGTRLALAPAVLASIYRDMSVLKKGINNCTRMKLGNNATTMKLALTLCAPLQLVQVWAMERFPALSVQPHVNPILVNHSIMARWHGVKIVKNNNLKLILDSAGERNGFLWRPYKNSPSLQVYNEKDMWICDNPNLFDELESFGRCMRVSELKGIGCIEQYLPHRVAMQFGMDQDVPAMVTRCNEEHWISYTQPIGDRNLSFVIGKCQPNVSFRYYNWWKQLKKGKERDKMKGYDHIPSTVVLKREDANHCVEDIAFGLENRIGKLERVIGKFKRVKFGPMVENIRAKAESYGDHEKMLIGQKCGAYIQEGVEGHVAMSQFSKRLCIQKSLLQERNYKRKLVSGFGSQLDS